MWRKSAILMPVTSVDRIAKKTPASRDAGNFRAGIGWRWGVLLGVPAHEGEAAFEDCVGYPDAEAHGSQGCAHQHHQIKEVLHSHQPVGDSAKACTAVKHGRVFCPE